VVVVVAVVASSIHATGLDLSAERAGNVAAGRRPLLIMQRFVLSSS
jgi:hypothetical protein